MEEEEKEDLSIRQPNGGNRDIQSANRQREMQMYRTNHQFDTQQHEELCDSNSSRIGDSRRPIATAPETMGRRTYFQAVREEPEHENMDDLIMSSPKIDEMSIRSFR